MRTSLARWRLRAEADLSRLPLFFDPRGISIAEGVRAALAIAAIGVLDEFHPIPGLSIAALGALLTCLCDAGGPVRRRTVTLLSFVVAGAALATAFALLRPLGLAVAVPAASAAIFACAYLRAWNPAAMQVGNLLIVVVVLVLDRVLPWQAAIELGALFGAGGLWALLLTMVIWRIHPYRPARRALSEVFRRLVTLVTELVPLLDGEDPVQWEHHARAHRRHVRDAIEAARVLVLDIVRVRGGGSVRANQSLIQLEAADQLFGTLIALSDVLEVTPDARVPAARALPALRLLLAAIADATAQDQARDDPAVAAVTTRLLDAFAPLAAVPALAGLAEAIVARLRIALLLTTPDGLLPGREGSGRSRAELLARLLRPLRANLHWESAVLRHATRAAAVSAPALLITLSVGDAYAHWLTITLVLTLQPFFATTWQRALERSVGTVAGGVVAAGIATVVHAPGPTAIAMAPLAVFAFFVRSVSYGVFMACLTPMIVLLSELGAPGESEFHIAALRAAYTLAGGLLAVAAGTLLWPSWERGRVRDATADAIRAHAAYADLELAALAHDHEVTPAELEAVRRQAGLASNTLETALNRALQEPSRTLRSHAEPGLVVDAALRRMAGRLLALQHDPAQAGGDDAAIHAFRVWLATAMAALAADAAPSGTVPAGAGMPGTAAGGIALGRMGRQVELMAGALRPWATAPRGDTPD